MANICTQFVVVFLLDRAKKKPSHRAISSILCRNIQTFKSGILLNVTVRHQHLQTLLTKIHLILFVCVVCHLNLYTFLMIMSKCFEKFTYQKHWTKFEFDRSFDLNLFKKKKIERKKMVGFHFDKFRNNVVIVKFGWQIATLFKWYQINLLISGGIGNRKSVLQQLT